VEDINDFHDRITAKYPDDQEQREWWEARRAEALKAFQEGGQSEGNPE
jgi:hypothetical protein